GPHISALGFADQRDLLQRRPEVDFLVPFEGEYPMLGLCEALEHGGALESVQGLVFRKAGEAVATPQRKFVDDLDALPFPARHLMRIEKYRLILPVEGEPQVTNIVTSRGCPFRCNFCSATQIAGYSIRVRSPENTLAEVAEIMAAYKHLEGVFFYDDNFLVQRKRAVAMCEAIKKSGIDFRWGCYGRVDLIDDELAGILAGAGCEVVSFGVESGSPKVLQAMNKRTTPAQVYAAVKAVKKHGMAARSSFFFGYPGEGIADLLRTFRLMHKAKLTAKEITFGNHPIIYPGTGLYEAMKERHYLPEGFSWAEPTDLPCFKDVPIFLPPHDGVRQALIKALWAAKRWGIA
ncbi:MAG TPA: radical SAM protein, partial [archaeon]|nr:radical SAM protein [archaeon]